MSKKHDAASPPLAGDRYWLVDGAKEEFGKRIRDLMRRDGVNQTQLAAGLMRLSKGRKYNQAHISDYLRAGGAKTPRKFVILCAEFFRVTEEKLTGDLERTYKGEHEPDEPEDVSTPEKGTPVPVDRLPPALVAQAAPLQFLTDFAKHSRQVNVFAAKLEGHTLHRLWEMPIPMIMAPVGSVFGIVVPEWDTSMVRSGILPMDVLIFVEAQFSTVRNLADVVVVEVEGQLVFGRLAFQTEGTVSVVLQFDGEPPREAMPYDPKRMALRGVSVGLMRLRDIPRTVPAASPEHRAA